ncbi:LacI family DNA-binding transcriptional regulator [Maritalea sp.]|uniref:LacI family DNA-binding transcriptional regulator n=1 Tax=Maritalea sp. TaxID=2003361 RepID=UPI003EF16417
MLRPTIKTIATETGLSTATVSKALNGSPQVRPVTRDKVIDAANRLGYELNLSGVQLRTGKTHQIAMVTVASDPDDYEWHGVGYAQLVSGIAHALEHSPYRMIQFQARNFDESLRTIQKIVEHSTADGIVISGTLANDPRIKYMQERNFPFVTYGMSKSAQPHAFVDTDNNRIATICVERLLARGHEHIALLNDHEDLMYSMERLNAYQATLKSADISFRPELVANGGLTPSFGRSKMLEMISLSHPPTAYICANEASALGVLSGFHMHGYVHGRDAVVIATDDLNISQYFTPPITTCYLPISKPSQMIGEFMLRLLQGDDPANLQKLFLPDLIERSPDSVIKSA